MEREREERGVFTFRDGCQRSFRQKLVQNSGLVCFVLLSLCIDSSVCILCTSYLPCDVVLYMLVLSAVLILVEGEAGLLCLAVFYLFTL